MNKIIQYYAIAGKDKRGYAQIIVTVVKTSITDQKYTGKFYKTIEEANKDLWKLNFAGKIVGYNIERGKDMKKINKYLYGWKLYVNYGQGWEYEIFEETWRGYRENRKAYRENCRYPQKWSRGRELNPDYINATIKYR